MKIYLLTALGIGIFGLSVGAFGQTSTIPLYYLNGNIGVGITNPASKLVVFDGAGDVKVDILTSGPGNDAILNLMGNSGGGSDAAIQFLDADGIFKKGLISYKLNTGEMTFSTSANERIRITASGNVGIGTPAPGTTLDVVGTGKFSSNLTVDTNTLYVDAANHRVGIGTTSPERRIDQVGSIATGYAIRSQISNGMTVFPNTAWVTFEAKNQNQTAGNSVAYGFFTNDASGNDNYAAGIAAVFTARAASNVNADLAFSLRNGAEGHFERMRILSGGKIGIGTPAPTELLHVNGNIRTMVGGVVYTDTVSGMNCTFNIKTSGTGDPILFSQGYAERMRIWNGRVGIGTTTPAKTLDVAGAAQFSASTGAALLLLAQTDTTASQLNLQPFNGSNGSIIYTTWRTGSGVLQFAAGNQYPTMTLTDTGRLGIGTPAPDAKLHLFGTGAEFVAAHFQNGSGGSGIATIKIGGGTPEVQYGILGEYGVDNSFRIGAVGPAGNHNLQFHTGNTSGTQLSSERMRITADGKIGIGTPTPTERLDVNGNANVSGTLRAAEVIVTTESWADYVFEPDYRLMPLADVRQFIATKKHLPEIPSESDLKKTGTNVNKMQALQMKKIEELTLYILQLEDRIKALEARQSR